MALIKQHHRLVVNTILLGKQQKGRQVVAGHGVARALKLARIAVGLQQSDVAERLGVHEVTVSGWERGRSEPSEERLAQLAALYRTTPSALRYGGNGSHAMMVRESPTPYQAALEMPKGVRVWMHEFLLELARADVSDLEIEGVRRVLTSAETLALCAGGEAKDDAENEVMKGFEAFATAIRDVLRKRGYKVKAR